MEAGRPREREEDEEAKPLWLDEHRVQGLATGVEQIRTAQHAKLDGHKTPGKSAWSISNKARIRAQFEPGCPIRILSFAFAKASRRVTVHPASCIDGDMQ